MDIGTLKNNKTFYKGFEDEYEIELIISENPEYNIHIWEGYFGDIFDKPVFDGREWKGFTRDYQQEVNTYGEKNTKIDVDEYLGDLYIYKDRRFRFEETKDCYKLLCSFLEYAKKERLTVLVNWW